MNNDIVQTNTVELLERFLRYVRIDTTSDAHSTSCPSTLGQWQLARLLRDELYEMGITNIVLNEHAFLIARLPATQGKEAIPCIGFMAHYDTSADVPGSCNPIVISNYNGASIPIGDLSLTSAEFPELLHHKGDSIIVTDGTSLLGADDKAGIAEIMTLAKILTSNSAIPHGPIELIFTPDEETGKGMNYFPLDTLQSIACYTLDGSKAGEIEAECFNAYSVQCNFTGRSIHLGSARGTLANAVAMAASLIGMLPRSEAPESTDGYYGYFCPLEIKGSLEEAQLEVLLRDFSSEGITRRINTMQVLSQAVQAQFPQGIVSMQVRKQYLNMKDKLAERPEVLEKLCQATRQVGLQPVLKPIRGGTDGARLTELGIPTPNIFTGGYNFHSRHEWASLSEMVLALKTILELIILWQK